MAPSTKPSQARRSRAGAVRTEGKGQTTRSTSLPGDELAPPRLSAGHVARYLEQHGLAARRSLSQNHLVDAAVLEEIVALADIRPGRPVLEIGPGLGILTAALLAAGATVTAVEVDARLARTLQVRLADEVAGGRLHLIEGNALDMPISELLAGPYELVANLPYHITSPVLHRVLGQEPRPDIFVLMLQREVAERVAAPPGAMSYLSVFVQYHADVRVARNVPPTAFEPAPEVESALLVGETRPRRLGADDEDSLWRLVQAGFRERRKMLHNVLPRQLSHISRDRFEAALDEAGIAHDRRPQTVSVDEWLTLWRALGGRAGLA